MFYSEKKEKTKPTVIGDDVLSDLLQVRRIVEVHRYVEWVELMLVGQLKDAVISAHHMQLHLMTDLMF